MKIVVFGDSIGRGAFDTQYGGRVERLKMYGFADYHNENKGVYNLSVSSNDVLGVLDHMDQDIAKLNAIEPEDIAIVIAIGTNEPRLVDGVPVIDLPLFEKKFAELVEKAQQYTDHICIVGGFSINEDEVNPWYGEYYYNKDLKEYTGFMREYSLTQGLPFVDLRDSIQPQDLSDGLHPNAEGHQKIFDLVLGALKSLGVA